MHLDTANSWKNDEQIELSDAELKIVQGGHGATHKCTYGNYNDGNDCGGSNGDYGYNDGSNCGNYGGNFLNGYNAVGYLNGYNDGSSCDGSQGNFVIMQVLPSSSCYNPCG